jgi:hypothetical protein
LGDRCANHVVLDPASSQLGCDRSAGVAPFCMASQREVARQRGIIYETEFDESIEHYVRGFERHTSPAELTG